MKTKVLLMTSLIILASSLAEEISVYPFEQEYQKLYSETEDKSGLESIKILHKQLDDDNDGTIEPSETCDFIRADLHKDSHQQQVRQRQFHRKDSEITVMDLWSTWIKGDVHNWTVDQTVHWLVHNVELPQYETEFRRHSIDGTKLPQVALGTHFLAKILGVSNPIHRSKISLKAMDVVLFGPPKESSSPWKDAILVTLLCMAVTGLFLAYRQNKRSQDHLRKMAADMEGLSKAEEELQDLQLKLQQRELQLDSSGNEVKTDGNENVEVSRLKEEVEVLRNELHRAEVELEDRCWVAPPTLQYWLQMTYELESQIYNAKRKTAEEQFEKARELCEKLKKKRSSLVAAFVSTHGCSFDEVDKSILSAKMALHEVTQDLSERSHRWRQIESLCGLPIIANPGLSQLKSMVRHIGGPRLASSIPAAGFALDTEDTCSDSPTDDQAEVPTFPSRTSGQTSSEKTESTENLVRDLLPPAPVNRLALTYLKRNASSSGLSVSSNPSRLGASRVGPGGKKMIKSFSQGGTGSISNAAVSLDPKRVIDKPYDQQSGIITSISDSSLQAKANSVEYRVHWSLEQEDCSDSTNNVDESTGRVDRSPKSDRSKTVTSGSSSANEVSTETNVDSDCGSSVSDIDNNVDASKKTKKMRRLFTFNRKKEKVV